MLQDKYKEFSFAQFPQTLVSLTAGQLHQNNFGYD